MSLLERNLSALSRLDASLAERLRNRPGDPSLSVEPTAAGVPSMLARASDGTAIRLHSAYDPVGEARQFVDRRGIDRSPAFVLSGLGMGYHAKEMALRIPPSTWLLLVEAKEEMLRVSFEHVDWTPLLTRPRTKLFAGTDWVRFLDWVRAVLEESEVSELTLITYPPCVRLEPGFYERVAEEVKTAANRRFVEVNTLLRHAEQLETNAIRNIACLPASHGVRDFEGRFPGVPGFVVASGPSLNGQLDLLRKAAGRGVIVTVGKSMKLLLSHGIVPDFVATLDMTSSSHDAFRGVEISSETVLVYDSDSYHEIPRGYAGPKATYETNTPVTSWAAGLAGGLGTLPKGLSVAHTAFYFARALGVDPLILVGVDLALPGDRTHAEGVAMTWGGAVDPANPYLIEVPSVTGGTVRSLRSFLSFVSAYEVEIPRTKARVVNTSPDGALIRGAENLPLAEAMERYASGGVPVRETVRTVLSHRKTLPAADFLRAAGSLEDSLRGIGERCEAALRLLDRAGRLDRSNRFDAEELVRLGRRLEETRDGVLNDPAAPMLGRLTARTALEVRRLAGSSAAGETREQKIERELQWLRVMFEGYRNASAFFRETFSRMREEWPK